MIWAWSSKVCDRLSVLYAGMVVEDADVRAFFAGAAPCLFRARCWPRRRNTPTPTASLMPVPDAVIAAVQAEVAAADRRARHG